MWSLIVSSPATPPSILYIFIQIPIWQNCFQVSFYARFKNCTQIGFNLSKSIFLKFRNSADSIWLGFPGHKPCGASPPFNATLCKIRSECGKFFKTSDKFLHLLPGSGQNT